MTILSQEATNILDAIINKEEDRQRMNDVQWSDWQSGDLMMYKFSNAFSSKVMYPQLTDDDKSKMSKVLDEAIRTNGKSLE